MTTLSKIIAVILLLLLAVTPVISHAAAWNYKKDTGQIIHNIFFYTTKSFFNTSGEKIETNKFTKFEYNPYVEYGLTDDLTLGISPRFNRAVKEGEPGSFSATNLQSIELFSRHKIYKHDATVASLQPLIKFPGIYTDAEEDLLGIKQIDAEIRALVGKSFEYLNQYHYINLELAYRKRLGVASDEIRFDSAFGIRTAKKFLLLGEFFSIFSTNSADKNAFVFNNPNNSNLLKLQFSGVYTIKENIFLQLGGFRHLKGKNVGSGSGIVFSIWQKF